LDKYRKYVVYGPAIGLIIGTILGLLFGVVTNQRISSDMFYGAFVGAATGWGFRNYYDNKHKNDKE
jgi:uncharacterized membrane protein YfcA